MPASLARPDYALADNLGARAGTVFLTGTQALIRLALMQRRAAAASPQSFISATADRPRHGRYAGVGGRQAAHDAASVKFLPAINEELAATAVSHAAGQIRSRAHGRGRVRDVVRQGPGRRHAPATPSRRQRVRRAPRTAFVVAGRHHGCVRRCRTRATWRCSRHAGAAPANVAEYLEFGLYGWALSRSGNWSASPRSLKSSRADRRSTSAGPTHASLGGRTARGSPR